MTVAHIQVSKASSLEGDGAHAARERIPLQQSTSEGVQGCGRSMLEAGGKTCAGGVNDIWSSDLKFF